MRLEVDKLGLVRERRPILQDVSFTLQEGEVLGLIGPNGVGKTSLLQAVSGLAPYQQGRVELDGQDLAHMGERQRAQRIAYMQQDSPIPLGYRVEDLVLLARTPYLSWYEGEGPKDYQIVEAAMKEAGVWPLRHRLVDSLSGGERQRVYLAKALAQDTDLLCLDEPAAALDLVNGESLFKGLKDLAKRGVSSLVVVHDLELAAKYCSRLLLLAPGGLLAQGRAQEVLTPQNLYEAYGMRADVYDDAKYGNRRIYVLDERT